MLFTKLDVAVEVVGGAAPITNDGMSPSRRATLKSFKARITSDRRQATEAVVARVAATEMSIIEISFFFFQFYFIIQKNN